MCYCPCPGHADRERGERAGEDAPRPEARQMGRRHEQDRAEQGRGEVGLEVGPGPHPRHRRGLAHPGPGLQAPAAGPGGGVAVRVRHAREQSPGGDLEVSHQDIF